MLRGMLIPAMVFALFIPIACIAQIFSGKVADSSTDQGIARAVVLLHELKLSTMTEKDGSFNLAEVRAGHYHLHVTCIGYEARSVDIILPDDNGRVFEMKPTTLELDEAVVEDSYLKTDAAQRSLQVEQLNSEEMGEAAMMNLSQTMSQLPGVRSLSVGTGIAKPVIRGLSGNRVIVNQSGVKQEGQQWGNDHGLEIDPGTVERLELIKGPSSLLYGSDGLGGVINILPPAIAQENTWNTKLMANYNSVDESKRYSLKTAFRSGKFFVDLAASMRDYEDFRVPADRFVYLTRVLPIIDERLKNTAGRDRALSVSSGMLHEKGFWRLTLSHFDQKVGLFPGIFGIPTTSSLADDGDASNIALPRQEIKHSRAVLNINQSMTNGWLEADLGIQRNLRKELSAGHSHGNEPDPVGNVALELDLMSYSLNVRRHYINGRSKKIIGASASILESQSEGWEFLVPDYSNTSLGFFFTNQRESANGMVWNWGLRTDIANLNTARFASGIYDEEQNIIGERLRTPGTEELFWNFSGAMGFAYDLNDEHHIKLNLGKSFRVPNAAELASNGVHHGTFRHERGQIDLRSEHGYQLDAAWWYRKPNFHWSFTPYFSYYQDFIYLRPSAEFSDLPEAGQVYEYSQHNALFSGAELFVDWHPVKSIHVSWLSDGVFSYNLNTGLALPFTPPIRNRMAVSWENEGSKMESKLGFAFNLIGDQNYVDRNEEITPGYTTIDLNASIVLPGLQGLKLNFAVNNLLDRAYMDHLSRYRQLQLPAQGRNLLISLILPFEGKINKNENQ